MPRTSGGRCRVPPDAQAGYTIEEIDRALAIAREIDLPELQVALLWMARGSLLGVNLRAGHLEFVMGVSPVRAEDLMAQVAEHGWAQRVAACPASRQVVEQHPNEDGLCRLCRCPSADHWSEDDVDAGQG